MDSLCKVSCKWHFLFQWLLFCLVKTRDTNNRKQKRYKQHDLRSLPAAHTYDNCHTFNWKETHLLGRAQTKHARTVIQRGMVQSLPLFRALARNMAHMTNIECLSPPEILKIVPNTGGKASV